MSNLSCATVENIANLQSFNFRLAATCSLTSTIATFFVSLLAIYLIHTKSIFQSFTRIILYFNLFFANLHQVFYSIEVVKMIYKGIFMLDKTCEWTQTEKNCAPYSAFLYMGISGMVYAQTGLMVERAFATFFKNYTRIVSRITGISISLTVVICSCVTHRIITWNDPFSGYTISCFTIPKYSATRSMKFLFICVVLTLFNLVTSMLVMYYNKNLEFETRYKVRERFRMKETIVSTHTICVLSIGQFVTLFVYSFGMFVLKLYQTTMPTTLYAALVVWIYTLPYSALLFPLILIFQIRATKAIRSQKIQDITTTNLRQTQDDHINQINNMWN